MPRRIVERCLPKSVLPTIDMVTERNLCWGEAWGAFDIAELHGLAEPWRKWGAEITRRWIKAYPGSRPAACYITGQIEPWTWTHDKPGLRKPLREIVGCHVAMDMGAHMWDEELEHLERLGVLLPGEWKRAEERLDGANPICSTRYRPLHADPSR